MSNILRTLSSTAVAITLLWSVNASAGAYDGFKVMEKKACASCHNISGQIGLKTAGLWRKGPDLYYAGNKYNEHWLATWLTHPTQIRPAGTYYLDHAQTGKKWDSIRHGSFKPHVVLSAMDAQNVAIALSELKPKSALIKAEHFDPTITAGAMGDMMFNKVNGCMACHSIEPGYGGVSGPELYTAAERLKPRYMLSIIRDPQAWNHRTWMPTRELSEEDMQKTVNYIISLDSNHINENSFAAQSAAKNYRIYCMQCHGISGKGSGINSRDMGVKPRNHSDSKYLSARTDGELFKAIKEGGLSVNKSALMPPWGKTLSDVEIKALVHQIRKLCKCKYEGDQHH